MLNGRPRRLRMRWAALDGVWLSGVWLSMAVAIVVAEFLSRRL